MARTVSVNTQTGLRSQLLLSSRAFPLAESNIQPDNKESTKAETLKTQRRAERDEKGDSQKIKRTDK